VSYYLYAAKLPEQGVERVFQFRSQYFGLRFRERAGRLTPGATVRILPPKTTLLFGSLLLCAAAPLSAGRDPAPFPSRWNPVLDETTSFQRGSGGYEQQDQIDQPC
jgi:hypothetical protein